uniref:Uncharacterized protein n=1 Tax=Rhizobium meliloti TaxID=382 RepID=I2E1V6_RHIML|nr:short hypothetical protein [Sinorhizobium meliloti]
MYSFVQMDDAAVWQTWRRTGKRGASGDDFWLANQITDELLHLEFRPYLTNSFRGVVVRGS